MPTPPAFGKLDFQQAMQRLAPRGRIWRGDPLAIFVNTLGALAPTYARSTAAGAELLIDANPTTTVNLLAEWEDSLGLPDPCTASNPSIEQRQAAVRAKWGARGGLRPDYFITMAANLGFAITIEEFTPYSVDQPVDLPLLDAAWSYIWQVNAPAVVTSYFTVDSSAVDDPLEDYDAGELVCRITRDAPAGTLVLFAFS